MSDRLEWFEVTIPALTPVAAPVTIPCVFDFGAVVEIDVKVPPGPSGLMGFFIGAGGSQYVPRTVGSFIKPDNDYFVWPLQNAINSGSWSVTGYNQDIFDHMFQVFFQVNEVGDGFTTPASAPANSSDLLNTAAGQLSALTAPPVDPLSADFLIASLPDVSLT